MNKYVYIVKLKGVYLYDNVLVCHDNRKAANKWVRWAKKQFPEDIYTVSKHRLYSE